MTLFPRVEPALAKTPDGAKDARAFMSQATSLRFHMFVVPDGERVWVALGMNEDLVKSRAKGVLSSAVDSNTIAARTGLEAVREARSNAGGFFTLNGMLTSTLVLASPGAPAMTRAGRSYRALPSTTNRGKTPMPFALNSIVPPAGGGAGGTSTVAVRIPRAAIDDMIQLGLRGGL
jgi:hypothetical protein